MSEFSKKDYITGPLAAGWAATSWLGGRLVRGKLVERIPRESEALDSILLLNHAPAGSKRLTREMLRKRDDSAAMEVNTAMLLWLTGRQDAEELGEGHVAEEEFVGRTSNLMREIGIPGTQVDKLMEADLPRTVIDQQLSIAAAR